MWNLEKQFRCYMQGRSRDADIGKGHVDMAGRGSWDKLGDRDCIRTLPCTKEIPRKNLLSNTGSSAQCSVVTERAGMGWGEV